MKTDFRLLARFLRRDGVSLSPNEWLLEAQGVSFAYNGCPVLKDVDLRVCPGQMVGVIGPNGAGKSTLIKILSRLLRPDKGRVSLGGQDLTRWGHTQLARRLAVVPQAAKLPETFTAWEVVLMGRTPYLGLLGNETATDMAIAQRAMEETNTWHLASRLIGQLSGGERQRVVVARALAQEPRVLLLDEPTLHLDINHQLEILSLVRHLVDEQGLAVLAIFHDLNLAAQFCHELVLLCQGLVFARGRPEEVITAPNIAAVYGADVAILPHPRNGRPTVLPN
ncbi:MAG: heme ABC transporter ATP-binding protein [Anaerolineae bacterium]